MYILIRKVNIMARKIRPVVSSKKQEQSQIPGVESISAKSSTENVITFLNDEMKKKIEDYDNMKNQYSSILSQNEMLQNKLAEYISELDQTRQLQNENNELSNLNYQLSSELLKIKEDYSKVIEQKDQYLMKISDLTFENEKLNSYINKISSHNMSHIETNKVIQNVIPNRYSNNGYGEWN